MIASVLLALTLGVMPDQLRSMGFAPGSPTATRRWQAACRKKLFELMMGGREPLRCPLRPDVVRRAEVPYAPYVLEEVTIQALPDRRAHLWIAAPRDASRRGPAVLAIHGHGGTGEQIVRGEGLYWYGKALAETGYVVIAPDVGSHELQHADWTLMGERTWDCLRALDYAETRPDVDRSRMAVCGLSLGGETTMYVAALDTRLRAVDSAGWLTTVQNMRNGHCTCYDFPGLAQNFDFADIFGCIAPRPLVCEIGEKERAPGGFPVSVARPAFEELQRVYRVLSSGANAQLTVHPGGHVFVGYDFWPVLRRSIGTPPPYARAANLVAERLRRGEINSRAMGRAVGVLRGWWATRDARTGLLPRTLNERVWAPNDNAADLLPFLFLTEHYTGQGYGDRLRALLKDEARLTNRLGVLPDWLSFETGAWVHRDADLTRLIFCAAEYCKDGLMPMTEAMGRGPWTERMVELMDAICERAPVVTDHGRLPAADTEVNGDVLQVLGRLHALTRNERYLDLLLTIADAYCLEVIPRNGGIPAHRWDFARHVPLSDTFSLNDHGNEIVLGLVEAFIAAKQAAPEHAERYRPALDLMFERLFEKCRNADGLWVSVVTASTGAVANGATPDTWGYALCGAAAYADATGDAALRIQVETALGALRKPRYLAWNGADSYADSIEGGILLRHRFASADLDAWFDAVMPVFLANQRDNGIVEGWYGDGNFARTALMAALMCSQGAYCLPWQEGLACGGTPTRDGVCVTIRTDRAWRGRMRFDTQRHRETLHLTTDYPRLNKWPEWFTVSPAARYRVSTQDGSTEVVEGRALADGLELVLRPGEARTLRISPELRRRAREHTPR